MPNIKRANTSGITKSGVGISDVPDAPIIGSATDLGTGSTVSVSFTPAATGGAASTFTATSTPGSFIGTGASSPITVAGLTSGTSYTFKVKATNATGVIGPESSASNSVAPAFPVIGAYDSLATVTVGAGGVSSVTFSGIPTVYKQLQIRGIARGLGTNNASLGIQVNGDSSSNQSPYHQLYGDGSTASAAGGAASDGYTASLLGPINSSTTTGSVFAGFIIDILDYQNTNKLKTIRSLSGADFNGSGFISMRSSVNINTLSAISSLTFITYNPGGTNGFAQYSQFALYGVK